MRGMEREKWGDEKGEIRGWKVRNEGDGKDKIKRMEKGEMRGIEKGEMRGMEREKWGGWKGRNEGDGKG